MIGAVMVMVLCAMATLVIHLGAAVVARHRAAAAAGAARLDGWEVRIVASAAAGILDQRATARARAGPDLSSGAGPWTP